MNIKEARIKHGLTIKQVSEMTGVPYRSLQNWEAGVRNCPDYVSKMLIDIIDQKFNHQIFLEKLQSDLKCAESEETKIYISNLISDITEQLNK